jgi:succinate dehydrogenase / fumarate reductase, membrane anchor subunit
MQSSSRRSTTAFGDWLGLHLTGVLLVLFLLTHIWMVHYATGGETGFSFEFVRARLQQPFFVVLDLGLLVLALYHGLLGVRRFVEDLEIMGARGMKILTGGLVVLGLAGLYFGWLIYRAFVT